MSDMHSHPVEDVTALNSECCHCSQIRMSKQLQFRLISLSTTHRLRYIMKLQTCHQHMLIFTTTVQN